MANQLDEITGVINDSGRDINVIEKQIPIKVGFGSVVFEIFLWLLAIIPGLIFLFVKIKAKNYLSKLEQKVQHNASQIDNYLEQRVMILQNVAALVEKSTKLDQETMTTVAGLRSGITDINQNRNQVSENLDNAYMKINVAFEQYPELKSHTLIADAMQQNNYLQREITAAREVYNDTVKQWNQDINSWPAKMIVAARQGYTTRIPFSASKEVKMQARATFF